MGGGSPPLHRWARRAERPPLPCTAPGWSPSLSPWRGAGAPGGHPTVPVLAPPGGVTTSTSPVRASVGRISSGFGSKGGAPGAGATFPRAGSSFCPCPVDAARLLSYTWARQPWLRQSDPAPGWWLPRVSCGGRTQLQVLAQASPGGGSGTPASRGHSRLAFSHRSTRKHWSQNWESKCCLPTPER